MNKKGAIPIIIVLVLVVAAIVVFVKPRDSLFILGDREGQLAEEYHAVWADSTDGKPLDVGTASGRGSIIGDSGSIGVSTYFYGSPETFTFNKVFRGEDVALLVSGGTVTGGSTGGCTISPGGSFTGGGLIIYKAHTLDAGYDVIQDGTMVGQFGAENGFQVSVTCYETSGPATVTGSIHFIGDKARFCDVRDNEVWVQEQFAQPVNIQDLSFPPTQFCHEARPFTLRALGQGEKAIGKQEGIVAFNRGETIPSRELEGEILVINYATPAASCTPSGCQSCGAAEANVKKSDGTFACQSFAQPDEPRVIREREIVTSGPSTFTFSSTAANRGFAIGDTRFSARHTFECLVPEGIYRAPEPRTDCYRSEITFGAFKTEMFDSQSVSIDPGIGVQFFSKDDYRVREEGVPENNLEGYYVFSVPNPISLKVKDIKDNVLTLEVVNSLPANSIELVQSQTVLRTEAILPESTASVSVPRGTSTLSIQFDKSNLGLNELEVRAFYPVNTGAQVLIPGDSLKFGFEVKPDPNPVTIENVVYQNNTIVEVREIEVVKERTTRVGFFRSVWDWLKGLF